MNHRTPLRLALIQSIQHWQDPRANCAHFEKKITDIQHAHLIVLPEMFTTGFTMNTAVAEDWSGGHSTTLEWMKDMSARSGAHLCGSVAIKDNDFYYNRLIWVAPDGQWSSYDKRHLFSMAGEDKSYQSGKSKLIVELAGWKIRPLICYDLRFPVWSRNRLNDGVPEYDLLLYVANWPAPRISAWKTLLHARAIENSCYVAGLNRVGTDGNGMEYTGDSLVCDFKGQTLLQSQDDGIMQLELSANDLSEYREKFPVHKDADSFTLNR